MIRLKADFNGLFGDLLCLSHGPTALDDAGREVELRAGMAAIAFEPDTDDDGNPEDLVARGVVEPSPAWLHCAGSRWVLRIDEDGVRHEASTPPA